MAQNWCRSYRLSTIFGTTAIALSSSGRLVVALVGWKTGPELGLIPWATKSGSLQLVFWAFGHWRPNWAVAGLGSWCGLGAFGRLTSSPNNAQYLIIINLKLRENKNKFENNNLYEALKILKKKNWRKQFNFSISFSTENDACQ